MISDDETFLSYLDEESASSDEEASSSTKKRKIENSDDRNPKKVKFHVSIEETIEIELEKLTSHQKTMLGKMFTSTLAKPNERGEYEVKGINPVLLKDVLNFYEKGEISKKNYIEELIQTSDNLQIKLRRNKTEKSLYKLIHEDSSMRRAFEEIYNEYIAPIMSNETKKDVVLHIVNDSYREASEQITEAIHCSVEKNEHILFLNQCLYKLIQGDYFKQFLSSKSIQDFSIEDKLIDRVVQQFYSVKYKSMKIHYENKDDSSMKQAFEDFFNKYIAIKSNDTKKDLVLYIVNDIYGDASEEITVAICSVESNDHVTFLNQWLYNLIEGDFFKQFLSSQGIHDFCIEDKEIAHVGYQFYKQYQMNRLKYKIMKIHYENKDKL